MLFFIKLDIGLKLGIDSVTVTLKPGSVPPIQPCVNNFERGFVEHLTDPAI